VENPIRLRERSGVTGRRCIEGATPSLYPRQPNDDRGARLNLAHLGLKRQPLRIDYVVKGMGSAKRCDDTMIARCGLIIGMESNVMMATLRRLVEEQHRGRVAANAWAGES
jgi:hypothetical protein